MAPFPIANSQISSYSEFQKPSQTATEQGKVKLCLFNSKTTLRGIGMLLGATVWVLKTFTMWFWNWEYVAWLHLAQQRSDWPSETLNMMKLGSEMLERCRRTEAVGTDKSECRNYYVDEGNWISLCPVILHMLFMIFEILFKIASALCVERETLIHAEMAGLNLVQCILFFIQICVMATKTVQNSVGRLIR